MSDASTDGTERSITVTIEDFEDARRAGKQTQNELYNRFLDGDSDTFELTVRSVARDTDRALAKTAVLVWLVVVVFFIAMLSVLAILPGGIA